MSDVRLKIELGFESFGRLVYRHRWVAIILTLLLVAGMASGLPKLRFDTSTESFLHPDDPTLLTYNDFRRQFGRDELLVVAIKSDKLFTLEILEKLKALHKEIEDKTPHVDDVTSMVNARNTRGEGDRLIVEDLLENWPETDADLAGLRRRVLANPLYLNRMISADGTFTTIVVKTDTYTNRGERAGLEDALEGFDDSVAGEELDGPEPPFLTDEENSEMVNKVREIVARHEADDFKIYLAGSPVITDSIKRSMLHDARTFVKYVILTIGLCLLIMFRRPTGVILPLLTVALAVVSTMGLMARLGVAVTLPTNILPSFILAVGVGASVHVLALFYLHLDRSGDREESIVLALGHSGLAIVLTTMTTAAGLASFATASVAPIAHLGIFAAAGVIFALIFTILLLPAFLAILPARPKAHSYKEKNGLINRFLGWAADFSTGRPMPITALAAAAIALSIVGMTRLEFSHDPLKWLPPDKPIRVATQTVDHELRGSIAMEIVIDAGRENGLYEVETLTAMDNLAEELKQIQIESMFAGATLSLADMLKEIHQALNENRPDFYVVPQDPALIPQELLLFENSGSDDLEDMVDSRFQLARFAVKAPWGDAIKYKPFIDEVTRRFEAAFEGKAEITTTGMMPILVRTLNAAIHSAAKSYLIAFAVITVMMILLLGSVRLGLISMIPNLLPVVLTLGVIGWLGFPLDMFTMLIGSIAIGLAVDDTIHFMHHFRRYYAEIGDVRVAVALTLSTAGRAMLVTSVVLSIGFFVYMGSEMRNFFYFGLLTGITIITALLADFFLAPALMALRERFARRQSKEV